ncbi:MAG: leucine-rich repeat protein, partial [Coprobacillus sp.]
FMDCSSLKKVKFGNQVTLIDMAAFINSSIEEVELPASLKTINMYAFAGTNMMYVDIPESVTTINNGFFQQSRTCYIKKQGNQYIFEFPQQMDMTKTTITSGDQAYTQSDHKVIFDSLPQTLKYNYTVANSKVTSTEMDVTVKFIEQKYKVTFLDENGKTLDEVQVSAGDTASTNITPTKENYTFIGWDKPLDNITGDLVVKALYKGLPTITSQDIEIKINQSFDPLNYIQAKDADGHQIKNINILKNNVNMGKVGQYEVEYEVIDQWNGKVKGKYKVSVVSVEVKQYQIQFKNYNDEVIESLIVAEGKMPTPSLIPERNGYTFIGWDKEIVIAQMDATYTAVFKRLPIIIVQDVIIQLNQSFNPLDHIQAADADGRKITNIKIIKNDVNTKTVGEYEIEFEVIDQWNGKAKEKFKVYVEGDDWKYRVIEEKNSEVKVKALLHDQAYLVVEVKKVETNQLYQHVDQARSVIGSYEVRIVGKYKGKINVVFPIEKQYEGYTVYIQHLKKDGTIENFTRISKNQQVSVEVDELSPFIITIDKKDLVTSDNEVKTNDNGYSEVYIITALISLTIGLFIFKKKKDY